MARSIREIQQEFAEICGYRKTIIWELLASGQHHILREKIIQLIPDKNEEQSNIEQLRTIFFEKVWAQRQYTNGSSLSAIIYVLFTKENDPKLAIESKEFSCHPVIRTRKCTDDATGSNTSECCMIFVDEVGRVYQNWQLYLNNNKLPVGTMVAPRRGVYTLNAFGKVILDVHATPASSVASQVLAGADTTTTVAGILSACVPIAAVFSVPVAAPVIVGAAVVSLATTGYGAIRSGSSLIDRRQHDQPIDLGDRHARNDWLGVLGGAIGLGTTGAPRVIATAAAASPKVSNTTDKIVKGLKTTSIVLSDTDVANGLLDLILKYDNQHESAIALDVVQISNSLLLFTHSVNNFNLASSIVNAQGGTMYVCRQELRARQQEMFCKLFQQNMRFKRSATDTFDIIRLIDDMPVEQCLQRLYEINHQDMEKQSIKKGDGQPKATTTPITNSRLNIAASTATEADGSRTSAINLGIHFSTATLVLAENTEVPLCEFGSRIFHYIVNDENFVSVIIAIGDAYGAEGFRFFMRLALAFIDTMLEDLNSSLRFFISTESVLCSMLAYCQTAYLERKTEYLDKRGLEILNAIYNGFLSLNPISTSVPTIKCKSCPGYYRISEL